MASISEPGAALLRSRIEDTIRLCDRRSTPCFLGFLDSGEQAQAMQLLQKRADVCWRLFGGHADAERQILGVFPEYVQPEDAAFPLCACAFFYRQEKALSHRDFLGTLLSAGLRRETIGDILCGEGIAVVFLREEIGFLDIPRRVGEALERVKPVERPSLEDILLADHAAREAVRCAR